MCRHRRARCRNLGVDLPDYRAVRYSGSPHAVSYEAAPPTLGVPMSGWEEDVEIRINRSMPTAKIWLSLWYAKYVNDFGVSVSVVRSL